MPIYNGTPDDDTWFGSPDADTAHGADGADRLFGNNGDDILYGDAGNDYLNGGIGDDVIDGGDGDDLLGLTYNMFQGVELSAGDQFIGGSGTDTLLISGDYMEYDLTAISIAADVERISCTGAVARLTFARFSQFSHAEGIFRLTGSGTLDLSGGGFAGGSIYFDSGADIVTLAGNTHSGLVALDGGGGDDQLIGTESLTALSGGAGNDRLEGRGGDDGINGGAGDDILLGGDGNDTFYDDQGGGAGNDVMEGGAGNDFFFLDLADGFSAGDQLSGGTGIDWLEIDSTNFAILDFSVFQIADDFEQLRAAFARIVISGERLSHFTQFEALSVKLTSAGNFTVSDNLRVYDFELSDAGNGLNASAAPQFRSVRIIGVGGNDTITGSNNNDTLSGGGGADVIHAGGGFDTVGGGAGVDWIDGGGGDDLLEVKLGESVSTGDRFTGGAGTDKLFIEGVAFDQPIVIADFSGATIDADVEQIQGGGRSAARLKLSQIANAAMVDVLELHLADGGAIDLTGKQLRAYSTLHLSDAGNLVTLPAGIFEDVFGGAGDDEVNGSAQADRIRGGGGADHLKGNDGADILRGEGGADQLFGHGGSDFLDGGAGDDALRGGDGNDTYVIEGGGDFVEELAGEGDDIVISAASYQLADGVSVETLTTTSQSGTGAIDLIGNEVANSIFGNAGNNVLNGGSGDDQLIGYEGVDILVGGAGFDVMRGNTGNDFYRVQDTLDIIFEYFGEGDDTLSASASYQLADFLSIETMTCVVQGGIEPFFLIGNQIAQSIFGNAGHNLLNGGGGNDQLVGYEGNDILEGAAGFDVMRGNTGNDIYRVEDTLDQIYEFAGEGDDIIAASTSYTLGAGLSIETMTAYNQATTNVFNLAGNELGQSISGNDGANVLNGGLGIDLLRGYGGADIFSFTTAPDSAANWDVIADFVSGTDRIALDNAVFTGLAEGNLGAEAFVIGGAAADADDRIVYNQATGQLFFDADGNGAGAAALFATLSGAPALSVADFLVI